MAAFFFVKCFVIVLCAAVATVSCQDELVPSNATNSYCLGQMVTWCAGMRYPQQGAGMAMMSASYGNETAFFRVYCYSDSEGTNCTRNSQPWFACLRLDDSNNTFTYKGQVPTADSVDDDICPTADKALDDLFVQNLSYDNETVQTVLEKSMESFFNQMAMMQEQIEQLTRQLNLLLAVDLDPFSSGGFIPDEPFWLTNDNTTDTPMTNNQTNQPEPMDSNQTSSSVLTTGSVDYVGRELE